MQLAGFLKSRTLRRILLCIAPILLTLLLWAFWWEPSSLGVIEQTISVQAWHREHTGLKIAVMSDLHVGAPHRDLTNLKDVVSTTNARKPDLVLILGDFVIQGVLGGKFVPPEPIARELSALRAPLGVVAVLGNHDWWFDGDRVRRALSAEGITVLVDQNLRLTHNNKPFWLVGLDDLWTRGNHLQLTLAAIQDDEPVIVLTHNPDVFPDIPQRVTLTLAGHTHGGQVNLPFVGRPIVPSKFGSRYAYGLVEEDGKRLFVTGGVGTSIVPVRFRVKPEIAILTLIPQE
ncbi:MAG TPA: metallophosphoesterase [Terriglobia bacterium]|nr:metallophosphoesterase [Terriglobia bacterium]